MVKKILLIVFCVLAVAGIAGTAYWYGTKNQTSDKSLVPSGWTNDTKDKKKTDSAQKQNGAESSKDQISPESMSYETFASADQKLSLKYPNDWVKSEIKNPSSVVTPDIVSKYNLSIPLMATLADAEKMNQLSVSRYEFEKDKSTKQILDDFIADAKTQGTTMEIVNSQTSETQFLIESKYQTKELNLHSKEKLLLLPVEDLKAPGYLVTFMTLEKDWGKYQGVADYILNSAALSGNE